MHGCYPSRVEVQGHADEPPPRSRVILRAMAEIDPEERESILEELEDLESMRQLFEDRGYKGVMITCAECGEDHYYGWEMLKESLEYMLETGEPRMHEPAFEPVPDEYISWDYGRGYLDAIGEIDADEMEGPPAARKSSSPWLGDRTRCAYCRGRLPQRAFADWAYCPLCGGNLAPLRLADALATRGLTESEIATLLDEAGFEPPTAQGDAGE
ncbi:MAG: DUF5319 domain-containing protein [Actinobacteria bacterium]|nr:DUF5319 domain-containing protein [Actinomycetota bacterium]